MEVVKNCLSVVQNRQLTTLLYIDILCDMMVFCFRTLACKPSYCVLLNYLVGKRIPIVGIENEETLKLI